MHGLCRAIGAGIPYEFAGRTRILHPLRLVDWGVCEQLLLAGHQDAFDFAIGSRLAIGKEIRPALREACKKTNYLSFEDVSDFIDTEHGIVLTAWLCFRGAFEYQECEAWFQNSKLQERIRFCRMRNQVSSVDLMAHLDWPLSLETDNTKTNWMTWIRAASELICPGLSPQQVGELTLYQFRMLTCERKELDGVVSIHQSELREYKRRRAEAEERALI